MAMNRSKRALSRLADSNPSRSPLPFGQATARTQVRDLARLPQPNRRPSPVNVYSLARIASSVTSSEV
jgi:hypothetical protein